MLDSEKTTYDLIPKILKNSLERLEQKQRLIEEERETLENQKYEWEERMKRIKELHFVEEWVKFKVSGRVIEVSKALICSIPNTLLIDLMSKEANVNSDVDGCIKVDSSFDIFERIIDYYRYRDCNHWKIESHILQRIFVEARKLRIRPLLKELRTFHSINDGLRPSIFHVTEESKLSPKFSEKEFVGLVQNIGEDLENTDFNESDLVILSEFPNSVDRDKLGDKLADYVDKGGNVILCFPCNVKSYGCCPEGRFTRYHPFVLGKQEVLEKDTTLGQFIKDHHVMKGVTSIKSVQSSEINNRVEGKLEEGKVEVVARWNITDLEKRGVPMIAVRRDKPGLIYSIGFSCGEGSMVDNVGAKILSNIIWELF